MNCVGPGRQGRPDDRVLIEQVDRWTAILAGNGHPDAEPIARSADTRRDLSAVGDEERADGSGDPGSCLRRVSSWLFERV
jgi:hypothetical protein